MKWYDYAFCFFYADIIAGGLLLGNIFVVFGGIAGYILYEIIRKDEIFYNK